MRDDPSCLRIRETYMIHHVIVITGAGSELEASLIKNILTKVRVASF